MVWWLESIGRLVTLDATPSHSNPFGEFDDFVKDPKYF